MPIGQSPTSSRGKAARTFLAFEELESREVPATFYVSPTGNDSNNGLTPATPWRTFGRVMQFGQVFQPGDQILFEGGKTFSGQQLAFGPFNWKGTAANPITVGSYGTGRAIIAAAPTDRSPDGNTQPAVITFYDVGGVRVENLDVRGPGPDVGNFFHGIDFVDRVDDLATTTDRYRGITINQVLASGFSGSGVLFFSPKPTATSPNLLGYGDIVITNSTFTNNREAGVTTDYRIVSGYYPFSNLTISNSLSYFNPGSPGATNGHGFSIGGVDNALIERNVIHSNGGRSGNNTTGGASGILVLDSNRITVQYNEVFNMNTNFNDPNANLDGNGIDFDWGAKNSVMQYNYSHDNYGAGVTALGTPPSFALATVNDNNVIRFNIVENNGRRIGKGDINVFGDVRNLSIYNNTAYTRTTGISENAAFRALNDNSRTSYSNVRVFNNIFITQQNVPVMLVDSGKNGQLPTFNGNVYWMENGKFEFFVNGERFDRLSDFRSRLGQEMLNGVPTGLQVDPGVTGAGTGGIFSDLPTSFSGMSNYRLQADSAIRGRGLDLQAAFGIDPGTFDLFGNRLDVDPLGRVRTNRTANPGADQFSSRYPVRLLTDSTLDFTGVQGQNGWTYGYSDAQTNVAFPRVVNFKPFTTFSNGTWMPSSTVSSPGLSFVGGYPGFSSTTFNSFAVRRWVNPFTGYVNLSGRTEGLVTNGGDGTNTRLLINGRTVEVHSMTPSYDAFKPQHFYSVDVWMNAGDVVDMVIDPRANPNFDFVDFTMRAVALPGDYVRVADSVLDFRGTQRHADGAGTGNWQYGHYTSEFLSSSFTTSGWNFDAPSDSWVNAAFPFAYSSPDGAHPGPANGVTRRWTSGITGPVNVDIRLRRANETFTTESDGVSVRVYHNGVGVLDVGMDPLRFLNNLPTQSRDASDINSRVITLPFFVRPGDTIDLVTVPRNQNFFDGTTVSMAISRRTSSDANYPNWAAGTVLADSVAGFSGTQGANGWRYGVSDAQVGVNNPGVVNFRELTTFSSGQWSTGASPTISAFNQHPGFSTGAVNAWAVRRWTNSSFTGNVNLFGVIQPNQNGGVGNGVIARIFKNGVQVFSQFIPPTGVAFGAGNTFALSLGIAAGDVLDFVIDPNGNPGFDGTDFTVQIRR